VQYILSTLKVEQVAVTSEMNGSERIIIASKDETLSSPLLAAASAVVLDETVLRCGALDTVEQWLSASPKWNTDRLRVIAVTR
jgi:hypothetical protein